MSDTLKAVQAEVDAERDAGLHPVRYCHGCGGYDDAPRFRHIPDQDRADLDTLHHVDPECHPDPSTGFHVDEALAPIVEARLAGKKDHELRVHIAHHARTLKEDPPDKDQDRPQQPAPEQEATR